MNQIATRSAASTAIAALGGLKAGLQNVSTTIVTRGGDPFLRLGTDGTWVYGAENVEVEEGSLWAVNPLSLQHGYAAWTDRPGKQANELVAEVMVPMTSALPLQHELQDVTKLDPTAEWRQQLSIQLKCISGEDVGEQTLYKTTSVGGMNAVKTLIAAIMRQLDTDPEAPVPVILLESDFYMHKKWGKTYTPLFSVQKWVALTDEEPSEDVDTAAAEPEAEPEPVKPARQRKAAAEPAKPAEDKATVEVTADDRKAALLAEIERLSKAEAAEAADGEGDGGAPAEPVARRRRR